MSSTKRRLVHEAFQLFGRNGFHGVGLDRVIDAARVSKQTFYNHFESKDELILAVLRERHESESKVFGEILASLGGETARGKLYALLDAMEARFKLPDWRGCIFMTAAAEFPLPHDPAHQAAREHVLAFQAYIQQLATEAGASDPAQLAEQLTLVVEGAVGYRHVTADPRTCEVAKRVAHLLLDDAFETSDASTVYAACI